jgi:glycosyltransferase involved in cell wall biosynthesis
LKILYITHNVNLRSTTCVIDAAIQHLSKPEYNHMLVFPEKGPWQESLVKQGINVEVRPFLTPEKSRPIEFIRNFLYWVKLILVNKVSIVHLNEHDNFPMIRHAAYVCRVPVIVGVRFVLEGGYAKWAFGGRDKPAKLLFTSQDQINRSAGEIPANIPVSDTLLFGNGRDLKQLTAVPCQRDAIRKSWNVTTGEVVLGTASVIRRRKLLEDFIVLVGRLKGEGFAVKGIIAGGGKFAEAAYFSELEQLIIDSGLQDNVLMIGNINDMAPFYQGIDIFVSTSELETFGMSVCEAMAFAKPVIGYSGGSVAEVLDDPSCIAKVKDIDALVEMASTLINEPELAQRKGEQGKVRAFSHFDAPMLASSLHTIYQQVLRDDKE